MAVHCPHLLVKGHVVRIFGPVRSGALWEEVDKTFVRPTKATPDPNLSPPTLGRRLEAIRVVFLCRAGLRFEWRFSPICKVLGDDL